MATATAEKSTGTKKEAKPKAQAAELMRVRFGKAPEPIARERQARPVAPFILDALRSSWNEFQADPNANNAYGADVASEDQAKAMVNEFRRAGRELGCGIAVRAEQVDGNWHVKFQAKNKKAAPKPKDGETTAAS